MQLSSVTSDVCLFLYSDQEATISTKGFERANSQGTIFGTCAHL